MPARDLFPSDWLVTSEYTDTHLGVLKSGKESEVHLVARSAGGRTSLLAEKRFTARERRSFQDDWTYWAAGAHTVRRGASRAGPRREQRAMRRRTPFGRDAVHRGWIEHEWSTLLLFHAAGVTVPPPVERTEHGYLMAFIGDGTRAAPRLSEVRLEGDELAEAWRSLRDDIALMLAADRVHGDLSAYNVLWWRGRPVVIDLSQAVDVITHPAARELLERDIRALSGYFARRGLAVDAERVLDEIGADDHRFARQVIQRPPAVS